MSRSLFALFSLVTFVLFAFLFMFGATHFNGVEELQILARNEERIADENKLKAMIARQEMMSFRQHVAVNLPSKKQIEKSYPVRNLASLVLEPNMDGINLVPVSTLFEQGRSLFRQKKYTQSNPIFRQIVEQYSDSVHVIESYFLLVEGLYQVRQFEACAEYVNRMMTLFPENELTGFSLLRLGSVYQERDRLEDAVDVFNLVQTQYKNKILKNQARMLASELQL